MNIINITDDNMSLCNCTDDDDNMMLEISPLFLIISIIPCFFIDNMLFIFFIIWFY